VIASLILVLSASLNAAAMKGCPSDNAWTNGPDWDVGQKLDGFDREALIHALHPDKFGLSEKILGVGVKPWPRVPGTFVALQEEEILQSSQSGDKIAQKRWFVAMVRPGNPIQVIARPKKYFPYQPEYSFNRFDLAPYRLNSKEYAFGLRWCHVLEVHAGVAAGNYYGWEFLDLFRVRDGVIEPILSTPMYFYATDGGEEHAASLSVSKKSTDGFLDLIKTAGKAKPAVFRWDGRAFVTKDMDPFLSLQSEDDRAEMYQE
jgi:hypothetical protein